MDVVTLNAAKRYAEQLGLGGAGLQEKVNEQVNVYLAENLYPVLENESGVTNTSFEYGDIRRYGAVGDGVTDDSDAIVNAFKSQKAYPNIIIKFEKRKTYICRKSPTIGSYSFLEGNEATLLIDKVINYGDTQIQFFWDNGYEGNIKIINWENLNIDFSPELVTRTNGDIALLWLFKIHDCEEFRMKNVNIISDGDEKNHINIFTFDGHGKIFMDNCYFKNTMRGKEDGSILWIQSKLADGYYARINNCHFYSNTWDEIISCFCSGSHDVVINGCTIEKYWYDTYYDRQQNLINFSGYFITNNYLSPTFTDEEIAGIHHNVVYQNCKMICKPLNPDTTIGIFGLTAFGNVYAVPSILKFVNCDIEIEKIKQIATSDVKNNYPNNIDWTNNSNIIFDNCNIKLSKFLNNRGIVRSDAANLSFQNCKMELDTYLCNQGWVESNKCSCFSLVMKNNTVLVTNANSSLFKVNPLAKEHYEIVGNNFITTDNTGTYKTVNLLTESTSADGYASESVVFYHSDNAEYNFYASGNRINHRILDTINKFNETTSTE